MYHVELVWNREFDFVPYGEPAVRLATAVARAREVENSGDGARVKKTRIVDGKGVVVWAYGRMIKKPKKRKRQWLMRDLSWFDGRCSWLHKKLGVPEAEWRMTLLSEGSLRYHMRRMVDPPLSEEEKDLYREFIEHLQHKNKPNVPDQPESCVH